MNEQRNLITAVVLTIIVLVSFQVFYEGPRLERHREQMALQQQTAEQTVRAGGQGATAGAAAGGANVGGRAEVPSEMVPQAAATRDRAAVLNEQGSGGQRVQIKTPRLHGSIGLIGARIDDLTLADYHETPDQSSPEIVLLTPTGTANPYYAESGWVAEESSALLPGARTLWQASAPVLTPESPVTLSWDNGQGLRFEKTIEIDRDYMFTIHERVRNTGTEPVSLRAYNLVSRHGTPTTAGFYILHEGPLGVLDGTLREINYEKLREQASVQQRTTGGWIGITDKYWLVSLVPDQTRTLTARFLHTQRQGSDRYQVDTLGEQTLTVVPGGEAAAVSRLFAGAKEVGLLDGYGDTLGIAKFDLAIDFGWFYFLTKPFFYALIQLNKLIGNFGIAILVLTIVVKGLFYPLANSSYKAMSKMKKLQPEIAKVRERCGDDKTRMNEEMMALYKREGANPVAGCLPILIQIPVFFALYKVLFVTIEMRHAPFYGWIHDLSAPDPTSVANLFGLLPFDPPAALAIGAWPLLMGVTMYLQQKLNPPPPDPIQAKMFMFLPFLFTFLLASFPAGLVIYWAWNNLLSILQQWMIMRRMGVKIS